MQTIQSQVPGIGIDFEDDNLTYDRAWTLRFCDEVVRSFGRRKLSLSAMNGLCAADLDSQRLSALWSAGFTRLDISLGVHGDKTQSEQRRPVKTPQVLSIARLARMSGFDVTLYFILGMPGQTIPEAAEAIRELSAEPAFVAASVYYPIPGTPDFSLCMERGWIDAAHPELWRSSCIPVETETLNRLDLVTFLRILRMVHFLKRYATAQQIGALGKRKTEVPGALHQDEVGIGLWLAELVLKERTFFSLRVDEPGHFQVEQLPTSKRVLDRVLGPGDLSWIQPPSL